METSNIKLGVSVPKTKAVGGCDTTTMASKDCAIILLRNEPRVSTVELAGHLHNKHRGVMALVNRYREQFARFGQLTFKKAVGDRQQGGGNPERFALLNENQALFLLSLSRNSERVVELKACLIEAFARARRAAEMHQSDYLPAYRLFHDAIKTVANGSPNERHYHVNANRALNKLAGLQPGQRASAGPGVLSVLTVAQALAAKAVLDSNGAKGLHDRIKAALLPLEGVLALVANEGVPVLEVGSV